jgi:hypothetical protein
VSGNDVVVVASCVVSAADMLVVLDSGVVVLSGREDIIDVSSGVKEVVGAPKRWTWGVLVVATKLLCCENARLSKHSSMMLKLCVTDPRRMRLTRPILAASLKITRIVPPYLVVLSRAM